MKKDGFTLVELLATMVILVLLLLIAVPKIVSIIETSKDQTMISSIKTIIYSAEREYTNRLMLGTLEQIVDPIECDDVAELSAEDYQNCIIEFDENGNALVSVVGKSGGRFEGKYICDATKSTDIEIKSVCDSYVNSGLIVLFDGINNTGSGHSNLSSNWVDLSGNNYNGSFHGNPTWGINYLQCDGIDDDVYLPFFFHSTPTIEVVYSITSYNRTNLYAVYDFLGGGFTLHSTSSYVGGRAYINGATVYSGLSTTTSTNTIYYSSLTYDGTNLKSYLNGELTQSITAAGSVSSPTYDTIFALCAKSYGSLVNDGWSNLKIYSFRVYNRPLTENELYNNYLVDFSKYNL